MAEVTQEQLDEIQKENAKLREQIEEEEARLAREATQKSLTNDKAELQNENERLRARLEAAREATRLQKQANTPLEQAAIATTVAQDTPAPADEKKGK